MHWNKNKHLGYTWEHVLEREWTVWPYCLPYNSVFLGSLLKDAYLLSHCH